MAAIPNAARPVVSVGARSRTVSTPGIALMAARSRGLNSHVHSSTARSRSRPEARRTISSIASGTTSNTSRSRATARRFPRSTCGPDRAGSTETGLARSRGSGPPDSVGQASPSRVPIRYGSTVVGRRAVAGGEAPWSPAGPPSATAPDRCPPARTGSPAPRRAQPPFRLDSGLGNGGPPDRRWPPGPHASSLRGRSPRSCNRAGQRSQRPSGPSEPHYVPRRRGGRGSPAGSLAPQTALPGSTPR